MKKIKKVLNFIIYTLFIGGFSYTAIFTYAWLKPKLIIDKTNHFYLYDNQNNLYTNSNKKDWISLKNISPHLINATVSIEDKRFFVHHGFDYLRIIKAFYKNIKHKDTIEGASTITQQYAKNLFLDFDKNWGRKYEEAILTLRLETHYSKEDILEGYLNTINYGGVFGIENAAHYYFDKSAKDLNLSESTILAGIPKSPVYYSPLSNEDNAKTRQMIILNSMVKNNFITEYEKENALEEILVYHNAKDEKKLITLMYYQDAVMNELKQIKSIPPSFLKTGGLKIYTNLDMKAQTILDDSIKKNLKDDPELQVATVAMEPKTGKVLALAGGTDYSKSQFNRAINAKRAVGSTIKPFLYYAALENGFTPSTTFISEKTTFTFAENKTYSPQNYGDIYGNQQISMAAALTYSDNIYAVKTHLFLGEETLVDISKRLGIKSKLSPLPSLALGSAEINLMEMVQAYGAFANEGYKVEPYFINKVEDVNGNVLYQSQNSPENILNKNIVFVLNEMLANCDSQDFVDYTYPTCIGIAPRLSKKYAIKTGTTNSDHMIYGFNKDLVVGVWTGYDDNRPTPNANSLVSKYVWVDLMENYANSDRSWYNTPKNVVGVMVEPISGKLANNNSKKKKILYYIKGTEPYEDATDFDNLIPTIKEQ